MSSMLETPGTKPAEGGGLGKILGIVGSVLAIVALGMSVYLLGALRDARRQIADLNEQTASNDKKAKDLDLALAAVRGQTMTIAERAGVTEAELEKRAAEAQALREAQRKGQKSVTAL